MSRRRLATRLAVVAVPLALSAVALPASASDPSDGSSSVKPPIVGPITYPLSDTSSPLTGSITMTGDPKRREVTAKLELRTPTTAKGHVDTYSCAGDTCTYLATDLFTARPGTTTVAFTRRVLSPSAYPYVQQLVFDDTATGGQPVAGYENVLFVQQDVPSWPQLNW